MSVAPKKQVFALLDAFRGMGALCVMLYHHGPFLGGNVLASGYLAVDLFFMLSGFVIAYAYDDRLRCGLGAVAFLRLRLIRLYPVYLAGCLVGLAFVVIRNVLDPAKFTEWGYVAAAALRAMLFLPDMHDHQGLVGLFPFDQVAWSLSLEVAINVVYALLFRWLSTRVLAAVVACSAVVLAVAVARYGTIDMGSSAVSAAGGVLRCVFGFPAGVLLFRLRGRRVRLPRQAGAVMLAVAFAWLAIPTHGAVRIWHDLAGALLVCPSLVWLGGWAEHVPAARVSAWLGRISYPVYILHTPAVWVFRWLISHGLHRSPESLRPVSGLIFAAAIIVLADLSVRYYEAPLFRMLRRWRMNRVSSAPLAG